MSVTMVGAKCGSWLALLALLGACRPGEGQRCVCSGECRRGLVCAQNGRVLDDKECVPADDQSPAECVDSDQAEGVVDEGVIEDPPIYHDVGGKRDFEPGPPPGETDASSDAATTDASTTMDASTTTTASSSTGASTSAGSSSGTTNGSTGSP